MRSPITVVHFADSSLAGVIVSLFLLTTTSSLVTMTYSSSCATLTTLSLLGLVLSIVKWLVDLYRDSVWYGLGTYSVSSSLSYSGISFVVSEGIVFFVVLVASYYLLTTCTSGFGGCFSSNYSHNDPLLMSLSLVACTTVLLTSSVTVSCSHSIRDRSVNCPSYTTIYWSSLLVFAFGLSQSYEYLELLACIGDGAYYSLFYLVTSLHGIHFVVAAVTILVTSGYWLSTYHYNLGYDVAVWYYHLVDLLWLFVVPTVYVVS